MDLLLLALVIVLLAAAIGFGGFAWHLLREERRRSAARVAALSAALDTTAAPAAPGVSELFATHSSTATHGTPLIKLAVGVAMALILIVVIASANRGGDSIDESTAEARRSSAASTRGIAPLELISMSHTRNGETLTVSGLVRNPRGGASVAKVNAVVLAFNRAGAFVASARASLDFTTLDPGDESPFVVTIPSIAEVGRYRVSFRTEAGVVRHVDRRSDQTRLAAAAHVR